MPRIPLAFAVLAAALAAVAPVRAADGDEALADRVKALENQVRSLTDTVKDTRAENRRLKGIIERGEVMKVHKDIAKDAAKRDVTRHNVWANLDVQLYGKIKADAAIDTARTDTGNFARWVESDEGRGNDHTFNLTARETRLGLKVNGPGDEDFRTSGLVEIDFYSGSSENTPLPRMRHAFLKLDWPKKRFSVLAGQTWDVISPLNPSTLNYSVQWWVGNIGYRRPQVRATQGFVLCPDVELTLTGALARTIGHDSTFDPGDTGEDAGFPGVQGRASLSFPGLGGRKTVVGVSGHYAMEEYDYDSTDSHVDVDSWSANIDLLLPVTDWLAIKAEGFTGEDLDAYLGGIGQGILVHNSGRDVREVQSAGGWLALSLGPWDCWRFNVGCSGEFLCNDDEDFISSSTRTCNSSIFGNAIYEINPNASVGVEISRWLTRYYDQAAGDSIRVQSSFIYKF